MNIFKRKAAIAAVAFMGLFSSVTAQQQQDVLWLRYSAISPDGSKIAFNFKGDIYIVPSAGGKAYALTNNPAYDVKPVWSPNGDKIAFASDRNGSFDVYIVDATGGIPTRLTYYSGADMPQCFSLDGKEVLYTANAIENADAFYFPSGINSELYAISTAGGREKQLLVTPMDMVQMNGYGDRILFEDHNSYENKWRKHHHSSASRDLWVYDFNEKEYTQITDFRGEDRNPVWGIGNNYYFLSERNGSFNVFKAEAIPAKNAKPIQLTTFDKHPVRFLSYAKNGMLCFGFNGGIYTMKEGETPKQVPIQIAADEQINQQKIEVITSGATEMAVSPSGNEIAFVVRGEVFVTSVEYGTTKRITNTPQQERSVSFSPDGRTLLYAGERNHSWNIYEATIKREEEKSFTQATLIEEKEVIATLAEEFQPSYSPDGKEIAYLEERVVLKVYDKASKQTRMILPANKNYSYSDGDQSYEWSPDGKWFIVEFLDNDTWISEVGLVAADGKSEVVNLTQSGYNDVGPRWMNNGNIVIWVSDKYGYRSHGSWGSQMDVFAMFMNQPAQDRFKLSKEELELLKEAEKKAKEEEAKAKSEDKSKDKKGASGEKKEEVKPISIDMKGIEDRIARLTINSSSLASAVLSPDGEKLYYLSNFEKGFDLWVNDLYGKQTKLLCKLGEDGGSLEFDKEGKNLFFISDGGIFKIDPEKGEQKPISFKAEMNIDHDAERAYMFEHAWRQMYKKFYVADMHGINWPFYKESYKQFLPSINNNYDFSELLSELLGEVNASHTGSGYRKESGPMERTSALGLIYDMSYVDGGLKVKEMLEGGPFENQTSKMKAGVIIEKIDDTPISMNASFWPLLANKQGKNTLVSMYDPSNGQRWDEVIKPISTGLENELLYDRWVKRQQKMVEVLSGGKVGYVHVRGMDSHSYREVYSQALGKLNKCDAIIVDTRYNGGGWLHDDLVTLLSGQRYTTYSPRGQENIGGDPGFKWNKPSCVLMNEANYSDAHIFPFAYKTLGIGPVIGMPVAGTGTAVWWETMIDEEVYFGIPEVGVKDNKGQYLENQELQPDVQVKNDYNKLAQGTDEQLEKAVEEMLKAIKVKEEKK